MRPNIQRLFVLGAVSTGSFWKMSGIVVGLACVGIFLIAGGLFVGFHQQEKTEAQRELNQAAHFLYQRLHRAQDILEFTSHRLGYLTTVSPGNVRGLLDDTPLDNPAVLLDMTSVRWESGGAGIPENTSCMLPVLEKAHSSLVLHTAVRTEDGQPKGRLSLEISLARMMQGVFQRIEIIGLVSSQDKTSLSSEQRFIPLKSSAWGLVLAERPFASWEAYLQRYYLVLLVFGLLTLSTVVLMVIGWRVLATQVHRFFQKDLERGYSHRAKVMDQFEGCHKKISRLSHLTQTISFSNSILSEASREAFFCWPRQIKKSYS